MPIKLNDEQCLLWIKDPSVSPFINTKMRNTWISPLETKYIEHKVRKNILSEENIKNPKSFLNKIKRKCFYNSTVRQQIVDKIKEYKKDGTLRLYTLNDKYENAYKIKSGKDKLYTLNDKFENIEYTTPPFTREECDRWVAIAGYDTQNPRPNETTDTTKTASTAKVYDKIKVCDPTYIELIYTALQYKMSTPSILNKIPPLRDEAILYEKANKIIKNVLYRLEFMKEIDDYFLNHNVGSFDEKLKISPSITPQRKAATRAAAKTANIINNPFSVSSTTSNSNSLNPNEKRQLRDLILEKEEEEKLIAIHQYKKGITKKKDSNSSDEIDITSNNIFISFKAFLIDLQNAVMKGDLVKNILNNATDEDDKRVLKDSIKKYFEKKGYSNIDKVLKDNNYDTIEGILRNFINNIFAQLLNPLIEELPIELEIGLLSYHNKLIEFRTFFESNLYDTILKELYSFIHQYLYNTDEKLYKYFINLIHDTIDKKYIKNTKLEKRIKTLPKGTFYNFYYSRLCSNIQPKDKRLPAGRGLLIGKNLEELLKINYPHVKIITDLNVSDFTYEECKNWVTIPIFNPRTFKEILIDSPIYNTLLITSYQYDTNLIPRMITSSGDTIISILIELISNILNKEKAIAQSREELENFIINNNIQKEKGRKEKEFIPSKIGLKWKNAGTKKPKKGVQLNELNNILKSKGIVADRQPPFYLVFTENELATAGITTVTKNSYIEIAAYYVIDISPTFPTSPTPHLPPRRRRHHRHPPPPPPTSPPPPPPPTSPPYRRDARSPSSSISPPYRRDARSPPSPIDASSISPPYRRDARSPPSPINASSISPRSRRQSSISPPLDRRLTRPRRSREHSDHSPFIGGVSDRAPEVVVSSPIKEGLKWKKVTDMNEGEIIEKNGIEINNKYFKKAFLILKNLQGELRNSVSFSNEYLATFGITTDIAKNSYVKLAYYYKPVFEKSESDIKIKSINNVLSKKRDPEYVAYNYYTVADCLRWARQPNKDPKTQQIILKDSKEYNIIFEQALVYDYNITPINITTKGKRFMKVILKTIKEHLTIAEKKKLAMSRGKGIADINSRVCNTINNIYDDETNDIGKKYKKFKDLMIGKCEQYNKESFMCIIDIKNAIEDYFYPEDEHKEYKINYYQESALASLLIFYEDIKNKIYKEEFRDIFIHDFNKFRVYIYEIDDELNEHRKDAIDAGGPKREFFTKLFEELFCDDEHLTRPFACPPDIIGNKYYINPNFEPDANFLKVIAVYNKKNPHIHKFKTERDYEYIYYVIGKLLCLTVYNEEMGLPKQLSYYILAGFINQPNEFDYYDILYFYLKEYENAVSLLKIISNDRINNIEDSYLSFNNQYNISKLKGSYSVNNDIEHVEPPIPIKAQLPTDLLKYKMLSSMKDAVKNSENERKLREYDEQWKIQLKEYEIKKDIYDRATATHVKAEGEKINKDNCIKFLLQQSNHVVRKNYLVKDEVNSTKSMKMRYKSLFNGFSDEIRKFLYRKKVRIEQLSNLITNEQLTEAILHELVNKIKVKIPNYNNIDPIVKVNKEIEMKQHISNMIMIRRADVSVKDHLIFIKKLLQYWTSLNFFNRKANYNIAYKYGQGINVEKLPESHTCFNTIDVYGFPNNTTPQEKDTFLYEKFKLAVDETGMENP